MRLPPFRVCSSQHSLVRPQSLAVIAHCDGRACAKDTMSLFRILDSVFRTQSEYVVDSTMKLFYPIKHLDVISGQVKRVNPFLITALVRQESAFQEDAHSRVGAVGLMQLMPATARLMMRGVKRRQLFQADTNLKIGIKYFFRKINLFNPDLLKIAFTYLPGKRFIGEKSFNICDSIFNANEIQLLFKFSLSEIIFE